MEDWEQILGGVRDLVEVIDQCLETRTPLGCVSADLAAVDHALGKLLAELDHHLCYEDLSEPEQDRAGDCYEAFHAIREPFQRLVAAVEGEDGPQAGQAARDALSRVDEFRSALHALFAEMARRPWLSPVPLVHSLLRLGRAVQEERHFLDLLHAKACQVLSALEASAQAAGEAHEDPASQDLVRAAEGHLEALRGLVEICAVEDRSLLGAQLDLVAETAQELWERHMAATQPAEAPRPSCPGCGVTLDPGGSSCPACGKPRPDRVMQALETAPAPEPLEEVPDYLQDLLQAAAGAVEGEEGWQAFQVALSRARRRLEQARSILLRLPEPGPEADAGEVGVLQEVRSLARSGLSRVEEGLSRLEAMEPAPDRWALDQGLGLMAAGIQEIRRIAPYLQPGSGPGAELGPGGAPGTLASA